MIQINAVHSKRDPTIDILRGIAVFTMIGANMSSSLLEGTRTIIFRFYGSFAAPIFILISGMMVSFAVYKKKYGLTYFLRRGSMLLLVGAALDIFIYRTYPFLSSDVLYLIALSMPLTYIVINQNSYSCWFITLIIFILTPLLQIAFGYRNTPLQIHFNSPWANLLHNFPTIIKQWLVDGWFPIFPWLGYSFLGANIGRLRIKYGSFDTFRSLITGLIISAAGLCIWLLDPGEMIIRNGFSELFYPPTFGYIIFSIGVILICFYIIDRGSSFFIYKPLLLLGRFSLEMYVLHMLISFFLSQFLKPVKFDLFILIYGITVFVLILISLVLKYAKPSIKYSPVFLRSKKR